jgi:hypothetical protein
MIKLRVILTSQKKLLKTTLSNRVISRLALKIVVMARQEAKGNIEEVLGDFTFLYIPLNFYVHLLSLQ